MSDRLLVLARAVNRGDTRVMRKVLSLIVFTAALIWTWLLIHSSPAVGFETHAAIQERLAGLILESLQQKKPEAKNVEIVRLWTETLDENKIRAHFSYRFVETTAEQEDLDQLIEGEAVLHREPSTDVRLDPWIVQSVKTTSDSVNFSEGTVITPNMESEIDPTAPPGTGAEAAPAPEAEKAKQ